MKVRIVVVVVLMAALVGACGSSAKSSSSSTSTLSPVEVDKQAAIACKSMEKALKDTADGAAISGTDAKDFQTTAGVLVKTPEGKTPSTVDPLPTWYNLGSVLVSLYVAVADQNSADVTSLTAQARALCVTIPESAQKAAGYTPVPTTP